MQISALEMLLWIFYEYSKIKNKCIIIKIIYKCIPKNKKCFKNILKMHLFKNMIKIWIIYGRNMVEILPQYGQNIVEIWWKYSENMVKIQWKYGGDTIEIWWRYSENMVEIQ